MKQKQQSGLNQIGKLVENIFSANKKKNITRKYDDGAKKFSNVL